MCIGRPGTTQIMILQLENDIKDSNEFHEDSKKISEKGKKQFFLSLYNNNIML